MMFKSCCAKRSGAYRHSLRSSLVRIVLLGILGFGDHAFADLKWEACTPTEVAAFENRIHIRCEQTLDDGIRYIALPTTDSGHASRVLTLMTSPALARRVLRVRYDPDDLTGASFGCQNRNCRRLRGVVV